jgi:putative redox protein
VSIFVLHPDIDCYRPSDPVVAPLIEFEPCRGVKRMLGSPPMSVKMSVRYVGGLRCELHHGPSGARVETDAPTDNHGKGQAFSPTDLVGAALASCAVTTMGIKAPAAGIVFESAEVAVEKTMTSTPPRRIARLDLAFAMPAGLSWSHRAALEAIARGCPVALSLSGDVELTMRFDYPDAAPRGA